MPGVTESNPGLQELVFGCFGLPLGLGLIVICGGAMHCWLTLLQYDHAVRWLTPAPCHAAELYTTNAAYMAAAFYEGRANVMQVAKNWLCSFFGNLVGSLICVWLIDEVST